MASVPWLITSLLLQLPTEYKLVANTSEQIPMALFSGASAHQEFRRWEAPGGQAFHVSYWQPRPARDGGPMYTVSEWAAVVAGQSVKVYEADYFMGRKQQVLVTYLHFTAPEAQVMLYATGLTRPQFMKILTQAQRQP